jgi:hypothetical protein
MIAGRTHPATRRPIAALTALAAGLVVIAAASPARAEVKVVKKPPVVERKTFDPEHPPKEMPAPEKGEVAITTYRFDCDVNVACTTSTYNLRTGGCRTVYGIQRVQVALTLTVTVWLPEGAGERLTAHEEGHREIAERMYQNADAAARKAADKADGRRVIGEGEDCAKAADAKLSELIRQVTDAYRQQVIDPTKKVQDAFDELTAHGSRREPDARTAIRLAFEKTLGKAPDEAKPGTKPQPGRGPAGTTPTSRPATAPAPRR